MLCLAVMDPVPIHSESNSEPRPEESSEESEFLQEIILILEIGLLFIVAALSFILGVFVAAL